MNTYTTAPAVTRFQTMASITVGAVIALILIGSLVRMTGSGMGCPDWPMCFGQIIPPTDVSQLPDNYRTEFAVAGKEIAEFDAFKTWVEYLNRLFGVLVGLLGIITLVMGFRVREYDKGLMWLSLGGLFLIVLAGGIGAYVVKTDLSEGMITVHMVVALGVLTCYLWAFSRSKKTEVSSYWISAPDKISLYIGGAVLALIVSQIVLGTQVREQVDVLLKSGAERAGWIDSLTGAYNIHKFSHYLVTGGLIWWFFRVWPQAGKTVRTWMMIVIGCTLAEVLMGLGMHHFEVPAVLQPLHLLFASLLFAATFLILRWLWMGQSHSVNREKELVHGH